MKHGAFGLLIFAALLAAALPIALHTYVYGGSRIAYEAPLRSNLLPAGTPVRLLIPSIELDAHVQSVGLATGARSGTHELGVPSNFTDVGWYNLGPTPGSPGSAVIDGHLDGKGVPQAVFYDLDKLVPGDLVQVIDDLGMSRQFRVLGSAMYNYDADTSDVFSSSTSSARLNLITCAGSWIKSSKLYNKRLVVFTELVSGQP